MKRYFLLSILVLFLSANQLYSQSSRDTAEAFSMIDFHYSRHIPSMDMRDRFGQNSTIGAQFSYKFASNWFLSLDYSFMFSENIKNEDSYFQDIKTSKGYVLDGNGQYAEYYLYQRGHIISLSFEKQFNFLSINANSGPFIKIGGGYIFHKVRIENPDNVTPQILGDYAKGYDRLTGGFSLNQMIGYRYISPTNIWNFYAGFEFIQAKTKSLRTYNFDDMATDNKSRLDVLSGFRIGWIIPIKGRAPKEFYYF